MNRAELQQLAEDRLLDAEALLTAKRWSGAYYLAGYAVECGLKSCVLAHIIKTGVIFEERRFSEKCWTHDIAELVRLADLLPARGAAVTANPALDLNWSIVENWSETSRYQQKAKDQAEELFNAVSGKADGVLSWLRLHW